jgi:hypothetical protein
MFGSGSLSVPDPNIFGGTVKLWTSAKGEWEVVPLLPIRAENSRCLGVADMATALRCGRPHRANGQMTYHVLDVMHSVLDASRDSSYVMVKSTCTRPAPMPVGLPLSLLDD